MTDEDRSPEDLKAEVEALMRGEGRRTVEPQSRFTWGEASVLAPAGRPGHGPENPVRAGDRMP